MRTTDLMFEYRIFGYVKYSSQGLVADTTDDINTYNDEVDSERPSQERSAMNP